MKTQDAKALRVAQLVRQREQPELAILFGSRARGDYDEARSDIDIMLVQAAAPGDADRQSAAQAALKASQTAYGREVPVQLVWRTLDEFRHNRRYVNSVETRAVRDGVIMPRDPNCSGSSHCEDEQTGYEYDWSRYDERLRYANVHLQVFVDTVELGRDDLVVGQQAQNALEHALKALLEAHGAPYRNTHDIGELLGNARHHDPELSEFSLAISPDIYTEYAGRQGYHLSRSNPMLTNQEDYLAKTVDDVEFIINRAAQIREQAK